MKKISALLLKIFLIMLLVFLLLVSVPVPVIILPTLVLYGTIAYMWFINKKPGITSQNVKVISKIQDNLLFGSAVYYVNFEFADGTRKTIRSTLKLYGSIIEGDVGILSYRECQNHAYLVDFQRNKEC